MLFSLSLRGWANTTQQMSWEGKGLSSQFEGTVRAREAWCQEYETHTQEGERDQCGSHPLMPLFPFYQYVTVAQNSACWGWVFPPQLVYLGIFSKTSPEGFFFFSQMALGHIQLATLIITVPQSGHILAENPFWTQWVPVPSTESPQ